MINRADSIRNAIEDLVADLIYYDRREDEELPLGAIEAAIEAGEITKNDMVEMFIESLHKATASA